MKGMEGCTLIGRKFGRVRRNKGGRGGRRGGERVREREREREREGEREREREERGERSRVATPPQLEELSKRSNALL